MNLAKISSFKINNIFVKNFLTKDLKKLPLYCVLLFCCFFQTAYCEADESKITLANENESYQSQSKHSQNYAQNYNIENFYFLNKVESDYQNEVAKASCKVVNELDRIEVSGIYILRPNPISQNNLSKLQNEASFIALYKVLKDCYLNLSSDKIKLIFSKVQNYNLQKLFIEQDKSINKLADRSEIMFNFVLSKNSVDFFVWKYFERSEEMSKNYIKASATIYSPRDIIEVEKLLVKNKISFQALEYRPSIALYLLKQDENLQKFKNTIDNSKDQLNNSIKIDYTINGFEISLEKVDT